MLIPADPLIDFKSLLVQRFGVDVAVLSEV
jgi:hypothetical protein